MWTLIKKSKVTLIIWNYNLYEHRRRKFWKSAEGFWQILLSTLPKSPPPFLLYPFLYFFPTPPFLEFLKIFIHSIFWTLSKRVRGSHYAPCLGGSWITTREKLVDYDSTGGESWWITTLGGADFLGGFHGLPLACVWRGFMDYDSKVDWHYEGTLWITTREEVPQ